MNDKLMKFYDVVIVGAGIVGLAHAYWAAKKGLTVLVVEKNNRCIGASVRNFGLFWPIGQDETVNLPLAKVSAKVWQEFFKDSGNWNKTSGSLGLVHHQDELQLINEFIARENSSAFSLLSPEETLEVCPEVRSNRLLGSLYSSEEITINSRETLPNLMNWLHEKLGVDYLFEVQVLSIELPEVITNKGVLCAKKVILASGAEFETLYPEVYKTAQITKCKLQMLKGIPSEAKWIGPALYSATSFIHYPSFANCPSLKQITRRIKKNHPELIRYGINLLVAQNNYGELILGDSHEYGDEPEPFNKELIDQLILKGIQQLIDLKDVEIVERWSGTYAKSASGEPYLIHKPTENVLIVNALGGAGMTISFGLAEKNCAAFFA
ncbi:MAG: TIGR03364 family FAD-dependent oxidoreductase [Fluviicola sp.]|nr:TIGR03364 family FAD-dependent oxidoreductase [Fluviicola sp.]